MSTEHLQRMFAHMRWGDELVIESLRAIANPPEETIVWLAHIIGAEHVWLSRIQGIAPRVGVWPKLSLDDCAGMAHENAEGFEALLRDAGNDGLSRPITYVNTAGERFTTALDDILLHVAIHGAHHRGQIAASLRRSGSVPHSADYITFVRGVPAATRTDKS